MSKEIVEAVHVLEREKGISAERLMLALEDALLSAYKKTLDSAQYARVEMDRDTADFKVFELLIPPEIEEQVLVEVETEESLVDPETGEQREPPEPELDFEKLEEFRDQIEERDVTPDDFGRIAAQTAKQVILQRIREAERDMMYEEYRDRVGELITGIVQQSDSRYTLVQLRERVEALLPKSEQVDNERYDHGQRVKAVITDVSAQAKGPSIIVSRRSPELIRKLFELEVPEIADGLVEVQNVAREPGYRSKIAVVSHASGVDPVGACVGPRGSRVRMVVSELRGEKIDIIPFNEEPARFVAKALSPARVREVLVDDESKQATVVVPDDQLSLAIGKEGQNARLAARLTGWRVDIRSETEFAAEEADMSYEEEEASGRCAAIMSNGRRCPNASLPGSRYCGLPAHQELENQEGDHVEGAPAEEPVADDAPVAEEPGADDAPVAEEPVEESAPVDPAEEESSSSSSSSSDGEPADDAPAEDEPALAEAAEPVPEPAPADPAEEQPPAEPEPVAATPDPESAPAAAEADPGGAPEVEQPPAGEDADADSPDPESSAANSPPTPDADAGDAAAATEGNGAGAEEGAPATEETT